MWVTDITEHPTKKGKLYFCAVKNVFSMPIIGYTAAPDMSSAPAVSALNTAVARRHINGYDIIGCLVHSDRGAQFRSNKYLRELKKHGLVGSMGRVASAGDNAAIDSFFSLLQRNVLNTKTWVSREELTIAIITWIERRYHQRRRQNPSSASSHRNMETTNHTPALKAA